MNILFAFPQCHRRGGAERVMVEAANFLAAREHRVAVMSTQFDDSVLDPQIEQFRIRVRNQPWFLKLSRFGKAAERMTAGLPVNTSTVRASVGVVCPRDSVIWVQSVHAEWLRISKARRPLWGRLKQRLNPYHPAILRLERKCYGDRTFRKLIALTPRIRDELRRHYGIPEESVSILPNGYNAAEFNPGRCSTLREQVRKELGVNSSDRLIVFVANELERKGFVPLARAIASLKSPELKLLVVGRASPARHKHLMIELGINRQVIYAGSSTDTCRYYAAADIFALPTYYEAWGLVIVEALASGVPVLTSRIAGAAVAVQDGITGELLDDPRDEREIAMKLDRMLRKSHPSPLAISSTVVQYRWERVLLEYEQILRNCNS